MQLTTEEFAQKLNIKRDVAYKLISFLEAMQLIENAGLRRKEGAKGAGAKVYEIHPLTVSDRMRGLIESLLKDVK